MSNPEQEQKASARQRLVALQGPAIEVLETAMSRALEIPDLARQPAILRAAVAVLERTERDQLGIFSAAPDQRWFSVATPEEKQATMEIMERCQERMNAQGTEGT